MRKLLIPLLISVCMLSSCIVLDDYSYPYDYVLYDSYYVIPDYGYDVYLIW